MDMTRVEQAMNQAVAHHRAGRLAEAERDYRIVLSFAPQHADALINLASIAETRGQTVAAIELTRAAINSRPGEAIFHSRLGDLYRKTNQPDDSIRSHQRAVELAPQSADAWNHLGSAFAQRRMFDRAVDAFQRAIQIQPLWAEVRYNLGTIVAQMNRLDEAIACFRAAIQIKPEFAAAHNNLGIGLERRGRLDEALAELRTALSLDPRHATSHGNIGNILKVQGRIHEAIAEYRQFLRMQPVDLIGWSNLLYAMQYDPTCPDEELRLAHDAWNDQIAAPMRKLIRPLSNSRDPNRRLRIAYVSPDFYHHAECFFVVPLLEAHDHSQFEIHCYASVVTPDEVTQRLQKAADVWHNVLPLSDGELAEQIRKDQIDILIDLSMHMHGNRLMTFARKPAPVQMTWLAYPGTTGLRTIDYRITDSVMDLPGRTDWFCEKPIRLDGCWCCFDPVTALPELNELPGASAERITFGSLNNFTKINDEVVGLWSRLLKAIPNSQIVLLSDPGEHLDHVRKLLDVAADRVQFPSKRPRFEYLKLYHQLDIALDPFPYNGITTTCDALLMGVPVLSLSGDRPQSRAGRAILRCIGREEWATDDESTFISTAEKLAADRSQLSQWRRELRGMMQQSILMDAKAFAGKMEVAYRNAWRAWCSS